jgi:hypothetical protein
MPRAQRTARDARDTRYAVKTMRSKNMPQNARAERASRDVRERESALFLRRSARRHASIRAPLHTPFSD